MSKKNTSSIEEQIEDWANMHDDLHIAVGDIVELIAAMIMAGLGAKDEEGNVLVNSLMTIDLKGDKGRKSHDGYIIYNKVSVSYCNWAS